jgi:hypothetical protein
MVAKRVCRFALCASLLVWAGSTPADEYRPDEFLGLDLSEAVLSPKPLGPPTEFAPVAVEARAEPKADRKVLVRTTRVVPKHVVRITRVEPKHVVRTARVVPKHDVIAAKPRLAAHHVVAAKPRVAAPTRLARRDGNPLDARAMDTRVQVWPCRSGGICDWKR